MRRDRSGLTPRRRDRGQSITINYTLSLIIVTVLMSGLFISMSGYLESQRKQVTRSELSVLGNRIAADIATVARLANTTDDGSVEVRTVIPPTVAGSAYEVEITSSSPAGIAYFNVDITLRAPEVGVSETVHVRTAFEVVDSDLNGGPYVVEYTTASNTIEVDHA